MKHFGLLPIFLIISVLASCTLIDRFAGREAIAKVGDKTLYKSETDKIIPKGISPEDSVVLVRRYINSWAVKQLKVLRAEQELPKQELDVESQLEDYKNQLLAFRYENMYIAQRLDTLVSENQMKEYYEEHKEIFTATEGIMKGRMLKLSNNSPNLKVISKQLLKKESVSETGDDDMEEFARSSSYAYDNYNNGWVGLNTVAKEAGADLDKLTETLSKGMIYNQKDSLYTTMVQSLEFVAPGKIAPYEFYKEKIKEIIISKRKQAIEAALQKDILNDALNSKIFKIIDNEGK
ncbi:MAG: hypothetical protein Q4C26_08740 [Bacteroidales bacterium]|nr:hypothetical protein [Bacteroidales bacterium]